MGENGVVAKDHGCWVPRRKPGRLVPRWIGAKLSRRRKEANAWRHRGTQTAGPMDIEALGRVVQSVVESGFGPGPMSLQARLRQ